MKTVKIDFKEVVYQDLDGFELSLPNMWVKGFGNTIYIGGDIPTSELGSKIYHSFKSDQVVNLNEEELILLLQTIEITKLLGTPAHNALSAYLTNRLENFK